MGANVLYWLLVAGLLWLAAQALSGPTDGLGSPDADARLAVYLSVFGTGLVAAAALRLLIRGGWKTAGRATLWLSAIGVAAAAYLNRAEIGVAYEHLRGQFHPSVALSTAQGEAELRRAWDGHYRAEAEINGVRMRLMIDTGASMVLLPFEAIEALGIDPEGLSFSLPVTTANGGSTVAPILLSSVRIGPIIVQNVQAAVAHPGRLETGLLGMSFLDRLQETSFRGDTVILRD